MAKYKPGQFIKTPFGRMRVRKENLLPPSDVYICHKCALKDYKKCVVFENMYEMRCVRIIPNNCYLEKV